MKGISKQRAKIIGELLAEAQSKLNEAMRLFKTEKKIPRTPRKELMQKEISEILPDSPLARMTYRYMKITLGVEEITVRRLIWMTQSEVLSCERVGQTALRMIVDALDREGLALRHK